MARRKRVRLLVAAEEPNFRQAIKETVESTGSFVVVAEAGSGPEAADEAIRTRPGLAVIHRSPSADGVEAARQIKHHLPECPVLILAPDGDPATLLEAVLAGANGYFREDAAPETIVDAVRRVSGGETLVPPDMLGSLLSELTRRWTEQQDALRRVSRLTRREKQVLLLMAWGANKNAIAARLVISPQTARTHVHNILCKLNLHSRQEAQEFVLRNAMVEELIGGQL